MNEPLTKRRPAAQHRRSNAYRFPAAVFCCLAAAVILVATYGVALLMMGYTL